MARILFLLSLYIGLSLHAGAQLRISGPTNCIIPGLEYTYYATGDWQGSDVPSMNWCAPGTINGSSGCVGGVLQIKVVFNSNFTSGSVSLTTNRGWASLNVSVNAGPLTDGGTPFPSAVTAYTDAVPSEIRSSSATGGTCDASLYSYQWESSPASTGPYTAVPGATQLVLVPPVSSVEKTIYVRLKTSYNGVSVYGSPATVTYIHEPVSGGAIYSNSYKVVYGQSPEISESPGRGRACGISGATYKWWYKPSPTAAFIEFGTGQAYPANGPVVTTSQILIRREITCGGVSAYSNELAFAPYNLEPGNIYIDDTVVVSGTKPRITQSPATGGGCDPATYQYVWQQSADGVNWQAIGTGIDYPVSAPVLISNVQVRRQITCSSSVAYSNVLRFGVFSEDFLASDRSYVMTDRVLIPGIKTGEAVTTLSPGQRRRSTAFYDGLGRPVQTVSQAAGGQGKDLVDITEYDAFGREIKKYLPYSYANNDSKASASNGKYKLSGLAEQTAFYQARFPNEPAYFKTVYEDAPENRVLVSLAPGSSWVGANRGQQNSYQVNTAADEIRVWNITYGPNPTATSPRIYPTGELMKEVVTDEQGLQQITYTNKAEQKILVKKQLSSTGNGHTGWLCTYYIYDEMGNLRIVLPPKAVEAMDGNWVLSPEILSGLCFQYQFDERGRQILKKKPGAAPEMMVYDTRDRLVFTQDGNMKDRHQWLANFYDDLNRVVMTALYNKDISRQDLQSTMNTAANNGTITQVIPVIQDLTIASHDGRSVYKAGNSINFESGFDSNNAEMETLLGPDNQVVTTNVHLSLPGISDQDLYPLTYGYFDHYNFPGKQAFNTGVLNELENGDNAVAPDVVTAPGYMTRGAFTGTRVRVLGTDIWETTTHYYDDKARVLQTINENASGGIDMNTYRYNFAGQILSTLQTHRNLQSGEAPINSLLSINSYDAGGRLLTIKKKVNKETGARPISQFEYNELGKIISKVAGNGINTEKSEYNIRGWLTGVNRDYLNKQASGYFGFELAYDNTSSVLNQSYNKPLFNGNITGFSWRGTDNQYRYNFDYDNNSRLMKADFLANTGSGWSNSVIDYGVKMGDGINPGSAYDANGNILAMVQNGLKANQSTVIDNLHYNYHPYSNMLKHVWDESNDENSTLGDFREPAQNNQDNKLLDKPDYAYDANGNLTKDENKGITGIVYNHLNLLENISFGTKGTIAYRYNAAGTRERKTVTDNTVSPAKITVTDYVNGYVYQNNRQEYVPHEEGKIRLIYKNGQAPDFAFDYFLKDHLNSTRVILTDKMEASTYIASMETANAAKENALFSNVDNTRSNKPAGYPQEEGVSNKEVSKISAREGGNKIGPSIVLRVMPGDTISISAKAFYKSGSPQKNKNVEPEVMANAVVRAFLQNGQTGYDGHSGNSASPTNGFPGNFSGRDYQHLKEKDNDAHKPNRMKAYLNYVLFDEQFKMVDENSGVKQVKEAADQLQLLQKEKMVIKKAGFMYVYTSTETQEDVYFDDVAVVHMAGPVLEECHYYPFGLMMEGISSNALAGTKYLPNKLKYSGKELQHREFGDGSGLELYDFGARMYDQQIGRFHRPDRFADLAENFTPYHYANNNPLYYLDINGDSTVPANQVNWPNFDTQINEIGLSTVTITSKIPTDYSGYEYAQTVEGGMIVGSDVYSNLIRREDYMYRTSLGKIQSVFDIKYGRNKSPLKLGTISNYSKNAQRAIRGVQAMRAVSNTLIIVGLAMDWTKVAHAQITNDPNKAIITIKAGVNTTVTAVCILTPGVGWVVAAVYYGVDSFYPGGWAGALETAATIENREREMTGHGLLNGTIKF